MKSRFEQHNEKNMHGARRKAEISVKYWRRHSICRCNNVHSGIQNHFLNIESPPAKWNARGITARRVREYVILLSVISGWHPPPQCCTDLTHPPPVAGHDPPPGWTWPPPGLDPPMPPSWTDLPPPADVTPPQLDWPPLRVNKLTKWNYYLQKSYIRKIRGRWGYSVCAQNARNEVIKLCCTWRLCSTKLVLAKNCSI